MRQLILAISILTVITGCSQTSPHDTPPAADHDIDTVAQNPANSPENNDLPQPSPPRMLNIQGSIGLPHIRLEGFPCPTQTGSDGCYQTQVPASWSGTIRPVSEGQAFNPPQRSYTDINTPALHEDYQAVAQEVTIAGSLNLAGVSLLGGPNLVHTDEQGHFKITVPHGWSGRLIPSLPGVTFTPALREYSHVTASLIDQHYQPLIPAPPAVSPTIAASKVSTSCPAAPASLPTPALTTPILLWEKKAATYANDLHEDLLTLGTILMDQILDRSSLVCPDPKTDPHFPQGLYLEGFGVLFTVRLEVPFPTLTIADSNAEDSPAVDESDSSSIWQRTRQRLFDPQPSSTVAQRLNQTYLNRLVEQTAGAMHQAVHIRHLTADDRIAVALIDPRGHCLQLQCPYDTVAALAGNQINEKDFLGFLSVILPKP